MFHRISLRKIGAATPTVPALKAGNQVLANSDEILTWSHQNRNRDTPALVHWDLQSPEGRAMITWGQNAAVWTRLLVYAWILPHKEFLLHHNNLGAPAWQGFLLKLGYQKATSVVCKRIGLTTESVQEAQTQVKRFMDSVAERLTQHNYLTVDDGSYAGAQFSALDLTMASYLAPLVSPAEYGIRPGALPTLDQMPDNMAKEVENYRRHPVGAYTLRMFKEHRRVKNA